MDNEGCPGCWGSAKGMAEQFAVIRAKAKAETLVQKKSLAIVEEGFDYYFLDAFEATQKGYIVKEVVSYVP